MDYVKTKNNNSIKKINSKDDSHYSNNINKAQAQIQDKKGGKLFIRLATLKRHKASFENTTFTKTPDLAMIMSAREILYLGFWHVKTTFEVKQKKLKTN